MSPSMIEYGRAQYQKALEIFDAYDATKEVSSIQTNVATHTMLDL
jgi:hypothetical protein